MKIEVLPSEILDICEKRQTEKSLLSDPTLVNKQ